MKKLLSFLPIAALVISLMLTGCTGTVVDSPWTSYPDGDSLDQQDRGSSSSDKTEESGAGEFDWESALTGTLISVISKPASSIVRLTVVG